MSWLGLGTVISRGVWLLGRSLDGARPMRTVRSTSALVPLEARSTARTGGPTSCGPWVPTGPPHTRQLVASGGLAWPLGQSTASIASSVEPAVASELGAA